MWRREVPGRKSPEPACLLLVRPIVKNEPTRSRPLERPPNVGKVSGAGQHQMCRNVRECAWVTDESPAPNEAKLGQSRRRGKEVGGSVCRASQTGAGQRVVVRFGYPGFPSSARATVHAVIGAT